MDVDAITNIDRSAVTTGLSDFLHTTTAPTLNRETLRGLLTNRDDRPEIDIDIDIDIDS